ncbi:hypothetical protein QYF61_009165 [Mycteria americana]|uniref:Uncharacterized protein n=1 Tax=Mycteria americana TaxID=33587 RepID=A0AAN7NJJ2_MYCAM|nr:hypothetical protein QYF61_009165 [Mycteria americana]
MADKYGEAWQIDSITLPQTRQGKRHVLTMVEATTGWLETYPVSRDGWNQSHFITPVSTLERERFKSHPSLSTTNQQMSPVIQSVGSTSSSPALLGIREPRSEYDRTQPSMQYYNNQGDVITHKDIYTEPVPAGSKMDPLLAEDEPISNSGTTPGITYLRRGKKLCNCSRRGE